MSKPVEAAPWSYSKVDSFEKCPKQFYHEKVLKEFPFEQTEAIIYGNEVHKAAELYVQDAEPIPKKYGYMTPICDALMRKGDVHKAELKFGLTEDLEPCGFFAKNVWYRGVVDLLVFDGKKVWITDYKTGKNARYADPGQIELMALGVFAHYPEVEEIRGGLLYVVAKELIKSSYTRDDIERLWTKWLRKFGSMEASFKNDVWNPNPSGLCHNHCRVLECPHNGRS